MRTLVLTLATSALLLGVVPAAQAQISFDVHIGTPPPAPRAYRVPAMPGPDYVWVEGYWYPRAGRWFWENGYWTRPPYADAYWVQPYWTGNQYFAGHWEGRRGNVYHDHRWDRGKRRDGRRAPNDHDRRNGRRR